MTAPDLSPLPSVHDLSSGLRFLAGLPGYLRHPVLAPEAQSIVRHRLAHREIDFLALVREAVYRYSRSPYLPLLRMAGCEYGDLQRLIVAEGLEGALQALYRHGVFLTVDELKGRHAVVRGSTTLAIDTTELQNPGLRHYLMGWGGGSRGQRRLIPFDLACSRDQAVTHSLSLSARGAEGWSHALWAVPGSSALDSLLRYAGAGALPVRWFSPVDPASAGLHPSYRWSGRLLRWASLAGGAPLPRLEYVPLTDLTPVARWMREILRSGQVPHIHIFVSPAVRLSQAAAAAGIDIAGSQLSVSGEPATDERMAAIRRSGVEVVPSYGASEAGYIGRGCLAPLVGDEVHLFDDCHALIQPGSAQPSGPLPANALLLSSLRPTAKLVLINVSLGDSAIISQRSCGCPMEQLGWSTHLHNIRSFEKLTAGGMTFLDADVIRVLEQMLPAQFGGGLNDYQLVEEQGRGGYASVTLRVHPRLGPLDEQAVADAFLRAIGGGSGAARVMEQMWRHAGLLAVRREIPKAVPSGKILHLDSKVPPVPTPGRHDE